MVSGLVKTSSWGAIATLPDDCRPTGRLAFNLNNNEYQSQVDVLPNGQVLWMAGGKSHGWLSLSGIAFATTAGTSLTTASGWKDYGGDYKGLTYWMQGNLCMVAGMVKDGNWGQCFTTLPANCRPKSGRLIFSLTNGASQARVDVQTNGCVTWHAGGRTNGWFSLTGILFSPSSGDAVTRIGWVRFAFAAATLNERSFSMNDAVLFMNLCD